MKTLVILLAPLAMMAQAPVVRSGLPLLAQASHSAVSTAGVASQTNAFGSNNVAGNSIIVVTGVGNGGTATITDTNTNVYCLAAKQSISTTFSIEIFVATNIKVGANTVTITPTGTVSVASTIYEYTGLLTQTNTAGGTADACAAVIDQTNTGTATGTALFTGNVTPQTPNELAIAGFAVGTAAQTITVTSPFINDSGQQNVGGSPVGLFSFVSSSHFLANTGIIGASATITSEPWVAAIATFRINSLPTMAVIQPLNADPCTNSTLTAYVINVSSNTQIVAGAAQKNVYVCKMFVAPLTAAANVNIVESATSGNACATSPTGMMGGATAATGAVMVTNEGFMLPADQRAWMKTATAGDAMCIFVSAATEGVLWYVQQ